MEKKFKADNGFGSIYWVIIPFLLLAYIIYGVRTGKEIWIGLIFLALYTVIILSITIKEYVVNELNFFEIHFVLKLFSKCRRIAIGDMVELKKLKNNQLRINKVHGFEVLKVKESDIDALIAELKERNPRIKISGEGGE